MAWRLQIQPVRAFKRLIYFSIWTFVCYVVFKLGSHEGDANFLAHVHRGFLQKLPADMLTILPMDRKSDNGTQGILRKVFEVDVHVDNSPSPSEKEILRLLSNHSSLPLAYWATHKKKKVNKKSCVKYPSLYDLNFNNVYWQILETRNGTFYFHSAYYDDRWRAEPMPVVRVLGMIDRIQPIPIVCQLWFDKLDMPIFIRATYTYGWHKSWGNYKNGFLQPYVINCPVLKYWSESKGLVPDSVSLVEHTCDKPRTNLRVLNIRPPRKEDFAVCVKSLDFPHEDLSVRMVEWIELLHILGAKKIFMYELEMHPNITKVLRYYQAKGLVDLTKITLPGNQPNLPGFRHLYLKNKLIQKRQNEWIPYNDCLYRSLYAYEHIALLDVDEVIMPVKHINWKDLMNEVVKSALKETSYNVRNVYFFDVHQDSEVLRHEALKQGIPRYLHMLQHVYRSKNFTKPGHYVNCFHNTERAVTLHNHFPCNCLGMCTTYSINTSLAQLHHYGIDCVDPLKKACKTDFRVHTVRDTIIWRYKDELMRRTIKVLNVLGFFS